MGGKVSVHVDIQKAVEAKRSQVAADFDKTDIASRLDAELKAKLSPEAVIFTIAESKPFSEERLMQETSRGDHLPPVGDAAPVVPSYDAAVDRVYSKDDIGFPFVIVRPQNAQDISAVVSFAAAVNVPLSVACGCHTSGALKSGSICCDMVSMRKVNYDAATKEARVGGGAIAGDVDAALAAQGRFVPVGTNPYVGIGGLTLGGGLGWMSAEYGMTCDNLVGVEIVLATGEVVEARHDNDHKDLVFACAGGGGCVGIVANFVFATFEQPHKGKLLHGECVPMAPTMNQKKEVMSNFVKMINKWEEDGRTDTYACLVMPAGAPVMPVAAVHFGPQAPEGIDKVQEVKKPMKSLGGLVYAQKKWTKGASFVDKVQQSLVEHQPVGFYVNRLLSLNDVSDAVVDAITHFLKEDVPNKSTALQLLPVPGKARKFDKERTAHQARAKFWLLVTARFDPKDGPEAREAAVKWADRLQNKLEEVLKGTEAPLTHPFGNALAGRTESAEASAVAEKLAAIRSKYDPSGIFSTGGSTNKTESS